MNDKTKDIVVQGNFHSQLAELDKIYDTCKKLLATKHYAALGEAGIHAIMARAKALGIHPFEALNGGFHCINGKVGMSTEMMAALARQRGHSIQQVASSNTVCTLKGKRADNGDEWTVTFDEKDAMAAGLWNGPTWKKYPKVMLYNRCMSTLFRQLFPDLSLGAGYVEDELKEITRTGDYASSLPVAEAVVVEEEKPMITPAQYTELNDLIGDDVAYRLKLMEHLATIKVFELAKIPADQYPKILKSAQANALKSIPAEVENE